MHFKFTTKNTNFLKPVKISIQQLKLTMVSDFGPFYEPLIGKIVNINTEPYHDKDLNYVQLRKANLSLPNKLYTNRFSNGYRVTIIARDCLTIFCNKSQNRTD